jgi:hypothetical protein
MPDCLKSIGQFAEQRGFPATVRAHHGRAEIEIIEPLQEFVPRIVKKTKSQAIEPIDGKRVLTGLHGYTRFEVCSTGRL